MKLIRTEDAVGQVLCHDITQIIPGQFKGARFRKGHIVQPEDIPVLLSIGKENLYVWEKRPGILHEDEAAALLYKAAAGRNIHGTEPKEGKIELVADCDGLLKIDRAALLAVNRTPQMMIASIHGDLPVKKGQKLAGTRIIPLVIEQEKMDAMQAAAGSEPILNVLPFHPKKFAVITTGSEVFKGRIEDKFTPVLVGKLAEYGCEMTYHKTCDDDPAGITAAILEAKAAGCELIFTTGGMSVDPAICCGATACCLPSFRTVWPGGRPLASASGSRAHWPGAGSCARPRASGWPHRWRCCWAGTTCRTANTASCGRSSACAVRWTVCCCAAPMSVPCRRTRRWNGCSCRSGIRPWCR